MENSLKKNSDLCQQKVLSTQNSRNSTFTILPNEANEQNNNTDTNFRLFTFMNLKNEKGIPNANNKGKQNRKKSVKKIINKSLKRDSSGLINMIQQSRKKRQDFYKLILDSDSFHCLYNQRKCRTPTNIKQRNSNNSSMININSKKTLTPRVNSGKQNSFGQYDVKSKPKLFHAKGSHSELQIMCENKEQPKRMSIKGEKHTIKVDKIDKNEHNALMKKKKELQKKLLQINQTILLANHKKKNKVSKVKK